MQTQPSRKSVSRQQSLSDARQIAKMVLGREAAVTMAEYNSSVYRGVIIGHTRDYIIQQIGKQAAAIIHSKDLLRAPDHEFPWPGVGRAFSIHYARSHAITRETRERLREHGLSR